MTFTITKEFSFSAAHHLAYLPEGHKCRREHGHNYRVIVELKSDDLDQDDFVMDYGELAPFNDYLQANLDHRDLNLTFKRPTAELLATALFGVAQAILGSKVSRIGVSETERTWAWYSDS